MAPRGVPLAPAGAACPAEAPEAASGTRAALPLALRAACRTFDSLEARWEAPAARRFTGAALTAVFLGTIVAIELRRRGWLPAAVAGVVPAEHLGAVSVVFTFLLVLEVASLVFALARSVADSLGKQFELLALILIREAFVEFGHTSEPIDWAALAPAVPHIVADMLGALVVFALLVFYYRVQRHRAITTVERDRASFVCAKKGVSLLLLAAFLVLGIGTLSTRARGAVPPPFFATFYTILVLSDVLLVLVSLRYTTTFSVVFRNAAFAAATVLIRLALSAPGFVNVFLAAGATAFALATSVVYNAWQGDEGADHARRASDEFTAHGAVAGTSPARAGGT